MTTKQDLTEETTAEQPEPAPKLEERPLARDAAEPASPPADQDTPEPATRPATQDATATAAGETATVAGETATVAGETATVAGEAERAAAGRRAGFTRARVLGALAAMVAAALAATAVLQSMSASQARDALARLEAERALRVEVSGAASSFGQALLSYDYQNLQATRSTVISQATGDFLATYDEAFGGAMAQVIVKLKAVSHATVREVYLSDVDDALAHAIVVVDQQVNTAQAIRSVKDSHLKITLVKQQGVWKINDVTVLGAAKEDQYKLDGEKQD
ncbi:hypothetical protein ABZ297_37340 [Nonomuraea sp. NPDC005983]|uniref:hypothetical protein n=1 Tax=Nonomuraea sp. NPDC005983 TaxID=3155595 RepID=UPI0033BC20C0